MGVSGLTESEAMARALDLASSGWGRVSPNPLVGAVVIRDDRIVGEGFHASLGAVHAEVAALTAAATQAVGGTLVVTLEPCRHHGRTPPCNEAIIAAGIRRVVYAVSDPTERAGGGASDLRAAGIEIFGGLMVTEGVRLNAPFLWQAHAARPFVSLKLALSVDGAIAAAPGQRTQISGPEAWAEVHRLRAGVDAILVGRRTVDIDDPLLTPRGAPLPRVTPLRVVLDARAGISSECALVRSARDNRVLVVTSMDAPQDRVRALERAGAEVVRISETADGFLDPVAVLDELSARGIQSVLIEGGAQVAESFLASGLVERFHEFVGPTGFGPEALAGPRNTPSHHPEGWKLVCDTAVGDDRYRMWERVEAFNSLIEAA